MSSKVKRNNEVRSYSPREQLEVLLKINRPNFSELVAALKGGSSKNASFQLTKLENFDGAHD
jgi:hypothetical protein